MRWLSTWILRIVFFPMIPFIIWYRFREREVKALEAKVDWHKQITDETKGLEHVWTDEALLLADANTEHVGFVNPITEMPESKGHLKNLSLGEKTVGKVEAVYAGKPKKISKQKWSGTPVTELLDGHLYNIIQGLEKGHWTDGRKVGQIKKNLKFAVYAEWDRRRLTTKDVGKFKERNDKYEIGICRKHIEPCDCTECHLAKTEGVDIALTHIKMPAAFQWGRGHNNNMLEKQMKEMGQLEPVTLFENLSGFYTIQHGLRRVKAAKALGWKTIRAIVYTYPK